LTNRPNGPQFILSRVKGAPVSDEELILDLQVVARQLERDTIPQKIYGKFGTYEYSTLIRRFGSWNGALRTAGLSISNELYISDECLFDNILALWQYYGRQPRRAELACRPSTISQSPYNRRFGSWTATLHAFVDYANASDVGSGDEKIAELLSPSTKSRTPRDPSLRLRWKILQRDRFTCRVCGASPALTLGIELHVDHVQPWSKGGETLEDNLETLCSKCNLGKSNTCPE
jgi:hypothetical protein